MLPEGAPHKGLALLKERDRLRCDTAIYVGDDVTDEDVFGLDEPGRLLAIRVGPSSPSQASYYVRSQAAVDELFAGPCDLRPPPGWPGGDVGEPASASRAGAGLPDWARCSTSCA